MDLAPSKICFILQGLNPRALKQSQAFLKLKYHFYQCQITNFLQGRIQMLLIFVVQCYFATQFNFYNWKVTLRQKTLLSLVS